MLEHQIGDMKMAEDRYLTFALTKGRLADKTLSLLVEFNSSFGRPIARSVALPAVSGWFDAHALPADT